MANVLGELFRNIAAAIREKTGDTATMKPADFPEKISNIEAGGGGAKIAVGTYEASTSKQTIAHNLGVVPDIVICTPTTTQYTTTAGKYFVSIGISEAFSNAYPQLPKQITTHYRSGSGFAFWVATATIEETGYYITSADETSFSLMSGVVSGVWLAIGGLT